MPSYGTVLLAGSVAVAELHLDARLHIARYVSGKVLFAVRTLGRQQS
jgi:hypothetical protein